MSSWTESTPIIFFDVDGTIMDSDYTIPESAIKAIHMARKNGALCVICSGRPYLHVDPQVKAIGFDGYVCSCGMHVLFGDRDLFHATTPVPVCHEVIRLARASDTDVIYESEKGMFFDPTRPLNPYMKVSRDHFGSVGVPVDGDIDDPNYAFDKIFCWTEPSNPEWEQFMDYLNAHFHLIGREQATFEVVQKGCSKTTGIKRLLSYLGLPKTNTYAVGDSLNDLDVMEFCTHGIAMGNGKEETKARAEYVTTALNDDGIWNALSHYHLI